MYTPTPTSTDACAPVIRAPNLSVQGASHLAKLTAQLDASPPDAWKYVTTNLVALRSIVPMRRSARRWGAMFGRDYALFRKIPDNAPGKARALAQLVAKHHADLHLMYASSRTAPSLPEPIRAHLDASTTWHAADMGVDWSEVLHAALKHSDLDRMDYLMPRLSEEDPSQVAYFPTYQKMMQGRLTRCRIGRFLSSQFGDLLSDEQIKACVGHHGIAHPGHSPDSRASTTLRFIENDDPAGWEWVYEHGHKFSSCMCHAPDPKRGSAHVSSELTGKNHPVRAYAYPGNGLRLAYLGDPVHSVGGKVYARAIVRDDCPHGSAKQWVRIFGDDSIATYLKAAGFVVADASSVLEGLKLRRREHPTHDDELIVPYIDADDSFEDCGTYLLVTSSGDLSANSRSAHVSMHAEEDQYYCNRCGATHEWEDSVHWSEHEETDYCTNCEDDFTCAYVGRHDQDMVLSENTVHVDGENYLDEPEVLRAHDIYRCEACDDPHPLDDLTSTSYGFTCNCTDIVRVHEECPEGFEQAREEDAIQIYSREENEWVWLHEDTDADEDDYREYGPYDPRCVALDIEDEAGWDYALKADAVELHDPDTGAIAFLPEERAYSYDPLGSLVEYDPLDLELWGTSPVICVWADDPEYAPCGTEDYYYAVHPHIRDWHGPRQDITTNTLLAHHEAMLRVLRTQHTLPLGERHAHAPSAA